jgi:hypothetical protein
MLAKLMDLSPYDPNAQCLGAVSQAPTPVVTQEGIRRELAQNQRE